VVVPWAAGEVVLEVSPPGPWGRLYELVVVVVPGAAEVVVLLLLLVVCSPGP
jgi:hypothetical protein